MFYIQTQDGDLPYFYKVYHTSRGAHKAAMKFMKTHKSVGSFAVCDAFHHGLSHFYRETAGDAFVQEVMNDDAEVAETIHHEGT